MQEQVKVVIFSWEEFPQEAGEQGQSQETSPRSRVAADGRDETRRFCPVRQHDSPHCPLLQGHLFIFFFIHNAWKVPDISDPGPGQTLTHVFTSDFSFHYLSTKVSPCRTGSSVSSECRDHRYRESRRSSERHGRVQTWDEMWNILNIKIGQKKGGGVD